MTPPPTILVFGASGLIGGQVVFDLLREGFPVVAVARRFTPAQKALFRDRYVECEITAPEDGTLARLLAHRRVDIVVNCLGVLQDGPSGRAAVVHCDFVERLVAAIGAVSDRPLLFHLSIPGAAADDVTAFSQTKREAEHILSRSSISYAILRPGFVIGPAAYGGSALIRALAVSPFALPSEEASRPFAATDIHDIARTIGIVSRRWIVGRPTMRVVWEIMEAKPQSVDAVIAAFRRRFGSPTPTRRLPAWLSKLGARVGDACARLGWAPPIRTTARREMLRGIAGDPASWTGATGIEPASLEAILARSPVTVQEAWFARLYLLKPLVIGTLALFWIVSGSIALTLGREDGVRVFATHGMPLGLARFVTVATSLCDIGLGVAIAFRRTCEPAVLAGLMLSLFYLIGGSVLTPEFWVEPTGPLLKIVPTMVLMLVALAILPSR